MTHAEPALMRSPSGALGPSDTGAGHGTLKVLSIDRKQRRRNPAPPFTTSTLQQEAARKLGFSAQRTMRLAQQLYEGVDYGEGSVGLITYMRTDSVNLANDAVAEIRQVVGKLYGADSLSEEVRVYKTKSRNAQEAQAEQLVRQATTDIQNFWTQALPAQQAWPAPPHWGRKATGMLHLSCRRSAACRPACSRRRALIVGWRHGKRSPTCCPVPMPSISTASKRCSAASWLSNRRCAEALILALREECLRGEQGFGVLSSCRAAKPSTPPRRSTM